MSYQRAPASLNVLAWNCCGLSRVKAAELQVTLRDYRTDIALISETWFTKTDTRFIEGFNMYNAKHPSNNNRGGASVIIRSNLKHNLIKIIETDEFQAVIILINTDLGSFNVAAVYTPPKIKLSNLNYIDFLGGLGSSYLIGGDWNAKNPRWGSRITNPKGKALEEAVSEINANFISPGKPTFFPNNPKAKPDILDFFVFKNIPLLNKTVCDTLDVPVDHAPVTLSIFTSPILTTGPPSLVSNKTNWEGFRTDLNNLIDNSTQFLSSNNIDEEVELLVLNIQKCAQKNTPIALNGIRPLKIPSEILNLIRLKRRARRRKAVTRFPEDKADYNRLNRLVQKRMAKLLNTRFEHFISTLSNKKDEKYSLWKATKYLKRPYQLKLPIKKEDGSWANNSQEKANVLADHFETIFQPHTDLDQATDDEPELDSSSLLSSSKKTKPSKLPPVKIKAFTPSEVVKEIKGKIKAKKAPGFDLISGIILKNLPAKAIMKLVQIFNAVIKLKYVPKQWKKAEIIVLLKPDKPPANPSSYRPISLLPVIGKLFERLYIKRLNKIVQTKKILIDAQFGFREKHSTIEQLHRITGTIEEALEKGQFCVAVFLDVAQAFDRVWHEKLIEKLFNLIPSNHVELLASYLKERQFRIRFDDAKSEFKNIRAGVPQGSVLAPLIYALFTTDIPQSRRGGKLGVFADDTLALASSTSYREARNNVQEHLHEIHKWTRKDKSKLNSSKSVEVVFTNRKYTHIPLLLGNETVPHSNTAKYLGLTLDAKLRWKPHIKKKVEQLNLKFRQMLWLLGSRSKLPFHLKMLLYKVMLRPIWSYGCQLWGCAAKTNIKKIEVIQMKIIRSIVKARWYERNEDIRRELDIESVEEYITKMYNNYEIRLHKHPNPEALALLDWTGCVRRLKRRKPHELCCQGFTKIK